MKNLKTQTLALGAFLFLLLSVVSCAKKKTDDNDTPKTIKDTEDPVITYLSNINSLYAIGAKVKINAKITDNVKLKHVMLKVTNTTVDSVYLNKTNLADGKEYILLDSVLVNLTTTMADFEVLIQAEDSAGNKATSSKGFHVMN